MPPYFAVANFGYIGRLEAELFSKRFQCPSIFAELAHFNYSFLRYLRSAVMGSLDRRDTLARMLKFVVVGGRHVLQIAEGWIALVSVYVIDLISNRAWTQEYFSHQRVNEDLSVFASDMLHQTNSGVLGPPISIERLHHPGRSQVAYSADVRNCIPSFISRNQLPFLRHRRLLYSTASILQSIEPIKCFIVRFALEEAR